VLLSGTIKLLLLFFSNCNFFITDKNSIFFFFEIPHQQGPSCPFDFDCGGHGSCVKGKCICERGWSDFDCSENISSIEYLRRPGPASAPVAEPCPFNCSGHGQCVPASGCVCDAEWQGAGCEESRLTFCPVDYDCANGGRCENGRCVGCQAGYTGFDCRTEPHPVDTAPPLQVCFQNENVQSFCH
jgi:hypothetical protein